MVKGSQSLFGIYLRKEDSWSHFVTTLRNLTACSIKLPVISFLGQNSHGTRNIATCLASLTKVVAPSQTFLHVLKSCDQMYFLLRKTQKKHKKQVFLHISQEQSQLVTYCDHIQKHNSMLYKVATNFLFGSKFPRVRKHSHLLNSLNKSCSPFAYLYKYI